MPAPPPALLDQLDMLVGPDERPEDVDGRGGPLLEVEVAALDPVAVWRPGELVAPGFDLRRLDVRVVAPDNERGGYPESWPRLVAVPDCDVEIRDQARQQQVTYLLVSDDLGRQAAEEADRLGELPAAELRDLLHALRRQQRRSGTAGRDKVARRGESGEPTAHLECDQRTEAVPEQVERSAVRLGHRGDGRSGSLDERLDRRRGFGRTVLTAGAADCQDLGVLAQPGLPVEEGSRAAARVRKAEDPRRLRRPSRHAPAADEPIRRAAHGTTTVLIPGTASAVPSGKLKVRVLLRDGSPGRTFSSPRSGSSTTAATVRSRRMSPVPATQIVGWASSAKCSSTPAPVPDPASPRSPASQAFSRSSDELRANTLSSSKSVKSGCRKWLVCTGCAVSTSRGWLSRISTQATLAGSHSVSERELASGRSGRIRSASATQPALSSRCLMARYGGRPGRHSPPSTRFSPIARPSLF